MQGPPFLSAFSDCILDNVVGVCNVALLQYDAATLTLRSQQTCSRASISSHNMLSTQKKLYHQLQPQNCPITPSHALLTGRYALAYPMTQSATSVQPIGVFDLAQGSGSEVRMASYDLTCSYANSSPYRYALVFSRGTCRKPNPLLESVLDRQSVLPWLTQSGLGETQSLVILFNQKRKRKLWKRCLRDIFGYSAVSAGKLLGLDQGRRNSLDSSVSFNNSANNTRNDRWDRVSERVRSKSADSQGAHAFHQRRDEIPPVPPLPQEFAPSIPERSLSIRKGGSRLDPNNESPASTATNNFRLVYYNNNNRHVHSSTTDVELDKFLRVALEEHGDRTPYAWKSMLTAKNNGVQDLKSNRRASAPKMARSFTDQVNNVDFSSKPRSANHKRAQSLPVPPVARQSRTANELRVVPLFDHPRQPNEGRKSVPAPPSAKFFAANVTPPLDIEPPRPMFCTPPSPRKQPKKLSRLAVVLGHHQQQDNVDETLSELTVATPRSIKSPDVNTFSSSSSQHSTLTPSSLSPSVFSTHVSPLTPNSSTFHTNSSTNTFATLESWLTCNSLPSLVSDNTNASSTSSLGVSTAPVGECEDNMSTLSTPSIPRWHALSPPTSPSPPKHRLPEIPEIPERVEWLRGMNKSRVRGCGSKTHLQTKV